MRLCTAQGVSLVTALGLVEEVFDLLADRRHRKSEFRLRPFAATLMRTGAWLPQRRFLYLRLRVPGWDPSLPAPERRGITSHGRAAHLRGDSTTNDRASSYGDNRPSRRPASRGNAQRVAGMATSATKPTTSTKYIATVTTIAFKSNTVGSNTC